MDRRLKKIDAYTRYLTLFGAIAFILPFTGFPRQWKFNLIEIIALAVISIVILLRKELRRALPFSRKETKEKIDAPFIENSNRSNKQSL